MILTKEQVNDIDVYLKKEGIKYWDLRIEMVDHIVSRIEANAKTNDFKKELNNSLKEIGWYHKLSIVNKEGWQNVNKKYRRDYGLGFINFFKKLNNVIILILSLIGFYLISENISFKSFQRLSFLLFISPIVVVLYLFVKSLLKKYGRSVNLDYGFTYLIMSFLVLNIFPTIFKNQSESFIRIMWFILLPTHLIFTLSGYNVYKKAISKVQNLRKQLLS